MFDCSKEIKITARTDAGMQLLSVRWPSDQEWDERFLGRKIHVKRYGRGVSETIIDPLPADAKLYDKIKLNGAPPLTPAEANLVVERLATCEVMGVEFDGNEADVEMTVLTGTVHHKLRIPSADQVAKLNRTTHVLNTPYNMQQIKIGVAAGAALWDTALGSSSDYAGPIPANHKDQAVRAVIEAIDREMGATSDEQSF